MSENKPAPVRRLVPQIILEPDAQSVLGEALSVVAMEIVKFKQKTNKGQSLSPGEGRLLQGYIKSLVDLSREARERDDNMDLANLSDEDLLKMVQEIVAKRAGDKNGS